MGGDDPEGSRLKTNRTGLLLSPSPGHLYLLPFAPGLSNFQNLERNSHGGGLGTERYSQNIKDLGDKKGQAAFHI